jgi:Zn-dependent metalloprotease
MSNSRSIVSESLVVSLSFLAAVLLSPPMARGAGEPVVNEQPGLWVQPRPPHARVGEKPDLSNLPTISKGEIDSQAEAIGRIPNVRVSYWPNQVPRDINGIIGTYPRDANESDLAELMTFLRPMLLATGSESLEYRSSDQDPEWDTKFVRLRERINGLPVREASLTLEIEASTGQIRNVGGQFLPDRGLPKKAEIKQDQVVPILIETIRSAGYKPSDFAVLEEPELMYTMDLDLRGWLAWVVSIHYTIDGAGVLQRVFINAVDGTILRTDPLGVEALSRAVYNANGGTTVPGTPMSIPSTDPDAQAAYDNVAAPYNYLKNRFN